MKKVVIFGGGSGLSKLLLGLKDLEVELTTVVTIADDGGSTGKIRNLYDIPAPGDLRRVVVALSERNNIDALMNYRFDEQMDKHTVGNVILAALTNIHGDIKTAVVQYCDLLDVKQSVLPISNGNLQLVGTMKNGDTVLGETNIAKHGGGIVSVGYEGNPKPCSEVIDAILDADYILFSCGSLFTSILPNLAFDDVITALDKTKGQIIYVSNLMTQKGETDDYTLSNHIAVINEHLNEHKLDGVICNDMEVLDRDILDKYDLENSQMIFNDFEHVECEVFACNLVEISPDGFIRHDVSEVTKCISKIMGVSYD